MAIVEFTVKSDLTNPFRVTGVVSNEEAERLIKEAEGRIIEGTEADGIIEHIKFIANPSANATAMAVKKDS